MTKAQALSDFRILWSGVIETEPTYKGDVIAKREYWNNYTDSLCQGGYITDSQYDRWTNPFWILLKHIHTQKSWSTLFLQKTVVRTP